MPVQVVTVGVDDAESIAQLASRTFVQAYSANNVPEYVQEYASAAFDVDVIRRELANPDCIYRVAHQEGAECGYVKLCANQPIDELDDPAPLQLERIYVDGATQGAGIGRLLIDAAIAVARERHANTIWLAVWEQNLAGQRFYARLGFEKVGRTFFMLGPERQEDLILALRLD